MTLCVCYKNLNIKIALLGVFKMIKSFNKDNKYYYCKHNSGDWSQWSCVHEDGLETWAKVSVASYKLKRQDVIDNIERVDSEVKQ